jgi:hypothetical protein
MNQRQALEYCHVFNWGAQLIARELHVERQVQRVLDGGVEGGVDTEDCCLLHGSRTIARRPDASTELTRGKRQCSGAQIAKQSRTVPKCTRRS